jgi:hypothetical protein
MYLRLYFLLMLTIHAYGAGVGECSKILATGSPPAALPCGAGTGLGEVVMAESPPPTIESDAKKTDVESGASQGVVLGVDSFNVDALEIGPRQIGMYRYPPRAAYSEERKRIPSKERETLPNHTYRVDMIDNPNYNGPIDNTRFSNVPNMWDLYDQIHRFVELNPEKRVWVIFDVDGNLIGERGSYFGCYSDPIAQKKISPGLTRMFRQLKSMKNVIIKFISTGSGTMHKFQKARIDYDFRSYEEEASPLLTLEIAEGIDRHPQVSKLSKAEDGSPWTHERYKSTKGGALQYFLNNTPKKSRPAHIFYSDDIDHYIYVGSLEKACLDNNIPYTTFITIYGDFTDYLSRVRIAKYRPVSDSEIASRIHPFLLWGLTFDTHAKALQKYDEWYSFYKSHRLMLKKTPETLSKRTASDQKALNMAFHATENDLYEKNDELISTHATDPSKVAFLMLLDGFIRTVRRANNFSNIQYYSTWTYDLSGYDESMKITLEIDSLLKECGGDTNPESVIRIMGDDIKEHYDRVMEYAAARRKATPVIRRTYSF